MKHIIPTLTLTTLAAASAVAQTAAVKGNGLTYDRISVGYSKTDVTIPDVPDFKGSLKSLSGSFTALLGDYIVVGGSYADIDGGKDLNAFSGKGNTFLIGAKFTAGPGDVIVSYAYNLTQLSGFDGTEALAAQQETDTVSLGYRYAVSSAFELSAAVSRITGDTSYLYIDAGVPAVDADVVDAKDTAFTLGARYNITKQFDVSLNYTFADENALSISAGFNF